MKLSGFLTVGAALSALSLAAVVAATLPASAGDAAKLSNIPTEQDALFAYLKSGSYKDFFAKESERHPSAGPHTAVGLDVRVFLNDTLAKSLEAEADAHPEGAGVVKEMFSPDGSLRGWAVAVKTQADSKDGQGWYWYEVTSTTDGSNPVAAGNGVGLCTGCHAAGQDFVLSAYPLQ